LPEDFSNSQYEENLAYLFKHHPKLHRIFASRKLGDYRLCLNPDGSPNIICMSTQSLVYPTDQASIYANDGLRVKGMDRRLARQTVYDLKFPEGYEEFSPIQAHAYRALFALKDNLAASQPAQTKESTFVPYLRIYGVGLGTHILRVLKERTVFTATIVEPNLDLFQISLYTMPWQLVHDYFNVGHRQLQIIVGESVEDTIKLQTNFSASITQLLFMHCYWMVYFPKSGDIVRIVKDSLAKDVSNYLESSAGWYEDQRIGLYNAARNIKAKHPFFIGRNVQRFLRVLVIGSGPSLDSSIEFLKENRENAIYVSCGTALSALKAAGIYPDYQVIQERLWTEDTIAGAMDEETGQHVALMKLNVVNDRNDSGYRNVLVFQKYRDPGSGLLPTNFPTTQSVNPTVTNAGAAFAAALGASEIYLFGADYGSPMDSESMHAKNTIYDGEDVVDPLREQAALQIPGNFGKVVRTTSILSWSKDVTEILVKANPKIRWFNVGDGAFIEGSRPCQVQELGQRFPGRHNNSAVKSEISKCFSSQYDPDDVLADFERKHLQEIDEYFGAFTDFLAAKPQTKEDITFVLSQMFKAVNMGAEIPNYIPQSLFGGGLIRLLEVIFTDTSVMDSDEAACRYFEQATEVVRTYCQDVRMDVADLFAAAVAGRGVSETTTGDMR
jgi:hypothetical protein